MNPLLDQLDKMLDEHPLPEVLFQLGNALSARSNRAIQNDEDLTYGSGDHARSLSHSSCVLVVQAFMDMHNGIIGLQKRLKPR